MSNSPPGNVVDFVARLRTMADGATAAAALWPATAPLPAVIDTTADDLEGFENDVQTAYAEYKTKLAARDAFLASNARPIHKKVVSTVYFVYGKKDPALLTFGLETVDGSAAPSAPPDPPTGLVATESGATSVMIDWDPTPGAARYQVYVGTDMNAMTIFGSASSSELNVTGLTEGTKYFFYVTALNSAGESQPSNFTTRRTL